MAKVETKTSGRVFVLTLNEDEAAYVAAALFRGDPNRGSDTVYPALTDAFADAGLDVDFDEVWRTH